MAETCATCRFMKPYQDDQFDKPTGDCRRYPVFQQMYLSDWCGEHQPHDAGPGGPASEGSSK